MSFQEGFAAASLLVDQAKFVDTRKSFDVPLVAHSLFLCGKFPARPQHHRAQCARVFGSLSGIVLVESFRYVIRPTGIQATIGTFD
ncbi:MAG TPA: hypothetical protein V6C86_02280 [Oculatellaceae cyanobacterium]